MKKTYENTTLLYRIVSDERRVDFIITKNWNGTINDITEKDIISISFDELLRNTIEFHEIYPKIKNILSEQVTKIKHGPQKVKSSLSKLDDYNNDSNIILTYYLNMFRSLFPSESIYVARKTFLTDVQIERSGERIQKLINNIEIITDPVFFSHFNGITEAELITEPNFILYKEYENIYNSRYNTLVEKRPASFRFSDISLVDFFNDFSSEIFEAEEFIDTCKCCHKPFFGKKDIHYCTAPQCQKEYKRIKKNLYEKERRNAPYQKPISIIDDYISTNKSNFLKNVNNDNYCLSEFIKKEYEVKEAVREKMKERKKEGLPPDNNEMKEFLKKEKNKIIYLINNLKSEYENRYTL